MKFKKNKGNLTAVTAHISYSHGTLAEKNGHGKSNRAS